VILRVVFAIVAGAGAFLLSSLAQQFARGLEQGAVFSGTGLAVATVGTTWWVWLVGVSVLVIAFIAAARAGRLTRMSWVVFGVTVAVLLVAGSVVAASLGAVPAGSARAPVIVWLVDGATAPLTWAVAGVALALGIRTRAAR
jgi:hypothetical protein